MKKIKIYIFHPYSRIGGADLSLSRLINNLDEKKYSITFITFKNPSIKFYLRKKIKMHIIKKKEQFYQFLNLENLLKTIVNMMIFQRLFSYQIKTLQILFQV